MKTKYLSILIVVVAITSLFSSDLMNKPALSQVQRQSQVINRARRIVAEPIRVNIARPVFTIDNQPDVDLRPEIDTLGIAIRSSQLSRGTCSVFAMTFLLEFMYAKNYGLKAQDFSEEYLNFVSN